MLVYQRVIYEHPGLQLDTSHPMDHWISWISWVLSPAGYGRSLTETTTRWQLGTVWRSMVQIWAPVSSSLWFILPVWKVQYKDPIICSLFIIVSLCFIHFLVLVLFLSALHPLLQFSELTRPFEDLTMVSPQLQLSSHPRRRRGGATWGIAQWAWGCRDWPMPFWWWRCPLKAQKPSNSTRKLTQLEKRWCFGNVFVFVLWPDGPSLVDCLDVVDCFLEFTFLVDVPRPQYLSRQSDHLPAKSDEAARVQRVPAA